jgi:hypothetical protein
MANFNMHGVVRGAIQQVNLDTPGTVYISTGYTNTNGILTPSYMPVAAMLQVQADTHDALSHDRSLSYTTGYTTVYAFGNFSDLERPNGKGGDIINMSGKWYGIMQVLEWWPGWCSVSVTQQLNAASLAALQALIANGSVAAP